MPPQGYSDPVVAKNGDGGSARTPKINEDVPLPGVQATERIIPLAVPSDWFQAGADTLGTSLLQLGAVTKGEDGELRPANTEALARFYRGVLPTRARPSLRHVADLDINVYPLLSDVGPMRGPDNAPLSDAALLPRRHVVTEPEDLDVQRRRRSGYIDALAARASSVPQPAPGGRADSILGGFKRSVSHSQ